MKWSTTAFLLLALAGALAVCAPAGAFDGTTELVSVDGAGNQGNGASNTAAISAGGRYVAFLSIASNLVSGDTNDKQDVFVHDRQTGTTELVSVSSGGEQGNDDTWELAISTDGCHVAFGSLASNLVPEDTNNSPDIFVHDCQTGITERVSVDGAGNEANEGGSYDPSISADGRFVAFDSSAPNLVPGDTNDSGDVFVHDRQTGITERVSVDGAGTQANGWSADPDISADGRYVAFDSDASNLVSGDTNAYMDTFVHDRQTGITERVSVDSAGNQQDVSRRDVMYAIGYPAISADGRLVALVSPAFNLVPGDTNDGEDIFVHDRQTGITERVSVSSAGDQGNGLGAAISADGRYVAFQSLASSLAPGDTNDASDVFVHDRQTGTTERVSADSAGNEANGGSSVSAISADGRFVAFSSSASNLVPGDTNDKQDIFVHDRGPGAESATVTMALAAGWNHVCYVGAEQPVEAALGNIADSVQATYRFGAGGAWDRWFAGRPQASTMETVRPYDSLLVLTSETLTWMQTSDEVAPDTADLEQGWNARCYDGEDQDIDEAIKGIQGQVTIVYALIPGQGWLRYVPDRPEIGTLDRLQRHQAVLVLVSGSAGAVWHF